MRMTTHLEFTWYPLLLGPSVLAIIGSSFVIVSVSLLSIEQYIVKHLPAGVRPLA